MSLPLAGIRILDLTRHLPGPYATLVLGDLGASVDKLEEPGGDPTRGLPFGAAGPGTYFAALNRGKRSLVLNLKAPGVAAAVLRLAGGYDVLVEGFRPGVLDRLGLSHAALRSAHPRLVVCALSGFGQTGPDRLRAGHDLGYQARAGTLGFGGTADGPAMPGAQVADVGGALFAAVGILAALHGRGRSGEGRVVDVSLAEAATAFVHMELATRLGSGDGAARGRGLLDGGLPWYGLYRTADDRHLALGGLEPRFFAALCERLGKPGWVERAKEGGLQAEAVRAELAEVFASERLEAWETRLAGLDACVEPVRAPSEVPEDPQFRARCLFAEEGRGALQMRTPFGAGGLPPGEAPALGAHTRTVLREHGFRDDEIDALGIPPEP